MRREIMNTNVCSNVLLSAVLLLLYVISSAAGFAQSDAAFIERMEGAGTARVGTYPNEELARLDRNRQLTPRHLEAVKVLPNWVYALVEGMRTEGFDVWDYTEARMAVVLMETESTLAQIQPGILEFRKYGDAVPSELLDVYAQNLESLERAERLLDDLGRLVRYMESKDFVRWQSVDVGHRFREGDVVVAGDDTEILVRYDLGALARVQAGGSISVWRPTVQRASAGEVTTRLWRGIVTFYWPPGSAAERHFEVETSMVNTSIRGTEFELEHDGGQTQIRVISGEVAVTEHDSGKTILMEAGQSASFGTGQTYVATAAPPDHWAVEAAGPHVTWAIPPGWTRIPGVHTIAVVDDIETAEGLEAVVGWLDWYETTTILGDASYVKTSTTLAGRNAYRIVNLMDVPPGFSGELYIVLDPTPDDELLAVAAAWNSPQTEAVVQQILASIKLDLPDQVIGTTPGPPTDEPLASVQGSVQEQLNDIDIQISQLVVQAQQEWSAHPDFVRELHSFRVKLLPTLRSVSDHWSPSFVDILREMVERAEAYLLAHPTYIQELKQLLAGLEQVAGRISAGAH